jgi:SDR family mycofactocin-dependent oxidoreductase
VAIVTGAARGLGAATSCLLAAQGWRVVLVDACAPNPVLGYPMATEAEIASVRAACEALTPGARAVIADVRRPDDCARAVEETVAHLGRVDAAIACAGVIGGGPPAWATSAETWREMFAVNVDGVHHLACSAVPAILATAPPGRGRFVAVASAAGLTGMPRLAAYNAAKHAVIGYIRGLAADLGPLGVTANAVCPGSMRTPMLEASAAIYGLASVDAFSVHHLTGALLDPAEVASAIAYLCSPAASGITGAAIPVDAGMTV